MTTTNTTCPICDEGKLTDVVGNNLVNYKGVAEEIPSYYSVCDYCEMEQGDAIQTRQNKREMMSYKKRVDGLLSGNDIKKFREAYGVTQSQIAEILGGGPVAFSKYEKDDVSQSEPMDNLIRVCREFPEVLDWLAAKANIVINETKTFGNLLEKTMRKQFYIVPVMQQTNYMISARKEVRENCANEQDAFGSMELCL